MESDHLVQARINLAVPILAHINTHFTWTESKTARSAYEKKQRWWGWPPTFRRHPHWKQIRTGTTPELELERKEGKKKSTEQEDEKGGVYLRRRGRRAVEVVAVPIPASDDGGQHQNLE
jgi:hypothetical protein